MSFSVTLNLCPTAETEDEKTFEYFASELLFALHSNFFLLSTSDHRLKEASMKARTIICTHFHETIWIRRLLRLRLDVIDSN